MNKIMKKTILTILCTSLSFGAFAQTSGPKTEKALFILTSDSLQTQGMSMVLANAMAKQGTQVNVLLCDKAGDLALKSTTSEPLKPMGATPEGLMMNLIKGGAQVKVCALYLPNKGASKEDLREGITVASPPDMAAMMGQQETKVISN
jgi:predicted peroxiredoxin